jgi:general secretion pathway protein K
MAAGRVEYTLAHNAVQATADVAVSDMVLGRVVLGLLDPRPDKRWRTDGTLQELSIGDRHVRFRVQDELGRIDLNEADGGVLIGLIVSTGIDAPSAAALVDKVLDWRDPSPFKRLNGAKTEDYHRAGYAYGPRNGPFQSVDELRLVMGVTPSIFAAIEPAITVYSGRPRFDPQLAPRQALLALPTMDAARADAAMMARAQQQPGMAVLDTFEGRAFEIRMELPGPGHTIMRSITIRLSGNPAQPYWILNRQQR